MIIEDYMSFPLPFNPHFIIVGSDSIYLTADIYGELIIFTQNLETIYTTNLQDVLNYRLYGKYQRIKSLDFFHRQEKIVFTFLNKLYLVNYSGEIIWQKKGEYKAVYFQNEGIWAVKIADKNSILLKLYDPVNSVTKASLKLDAYGADIDMEFYFEHIEGTTDFSLYASHIDDQISLLIDYQADNSIHINEFSVKSDTYHFFNDSMSYLGETNIEDEEKQEIKIYSYPQRKLLAKHIGTIRIGESRIWEFFNPIFIADDKVLFFDLEHYLPQIFDVKTNYCIPFRVKDHSFHYLDIYSQNSWSVPIDGIASIHQILKRYVAKFGNILMFKSNTYYIKTKSSSYSLLFIALDTLSFPKLPQQLSLF